MRIRDESGIETAEGFILLSARISLLMLSLCSYESGFSVCGWQLALSKCRHDGCVQVA